MKCKDLSTEHILTVLSKYQGQWSFWVDDDILRFRDKRGERIVVKVFPTLVVPRKLMLRKWQKLVKQNLVGGCACGCRGDFEITDKGLALIGKRRTKKYSGY